MDDQSVNSTIPTAAGLQEQLSVRVAQVVDVTRSEGPGARLAIWVQGCQLRCSGCCNPKMLTQDGGELVTARAMLERVGRAAGVIEGISLLGGEPFDQAAPLAALARGVRACGLGVLVFSGYTLAELRASSDQAVRGLLEATDLLVDGPYIHARRSARRPWVGSDNQQLHLLTDRYRTHQQLQQRQTQSVHIHIAGDSATVSGWPAVVGSLAGERA